MTGTQRLDVASGRLTSVAGDPGGKPLIAIDTAQLGGMYANRITLLTTESGTGVRNKGTLQAHGSDGQLTITADGLLETYGRVSGAVVSLATVQGDIESKGTTQASKHLAMSSGESIKFWGKGAKQVDGSSLYISAANNIEVTADAELSSFADGGRLQLAAGAGVKLGAASKVGAADEVRLVADGVLELRSSLLSSGVGVVALGGGGISSTNSSITGPRVHLETGAAFSNDAASLTIGDGRIYGDSQTTLISSGNLTIAGQDRSRPAANASASELDIGTPVVRSDGNVHLQAGEVLTIAAGSSVLAGKDLTATAQGLLRLMGRPGTTGTNGDVVSLNAAGDLDVTGERVTQSGSILKAGGAVSIVARKGDVALVALSDASGGSSRGVQIDAGKDINVSSYQGGLRAAGLKANGQNIHLVANGITSVDALSNTTAGGKELVGSKLIAREDITVGSISADQQVSVRDSDLQAGGVVRISGNGEVTLGAAPNVTNSTGVTAPSATNIQGSRIAVQGASIQTDALRAQATAGDILLLADTGSAALSARGTMGTQLLATGNIAVHGNSGLTATGTTASAGGSFSSTSALGSIDAAQLSAQAQRVVSFASKGSQSHTGNRLTGGAVSVFSEGGSLTLSNTHLKATSTASTESSVLSGKVSVESGAGLSIDSGTVLDASTDLSIIRGKGDLLVNALVGMPRGTLTTDQLRFGRDLTLGARDGDLVLGGTTGGAGLGSSARVSLSAPGSLSMYGNSVKLQGSQINAGGAVDITATRGSLQVDANLVTNVDGLGAGNTQWDTASIKGAAVNVRAASNIELNATQVTSPGSVSILSGGDTVVAGKHYTASTVRPINNGDVTREDHLLVRSSIVGDTGVSVGALGGNLALNAADVSARLGVLRLQALGNITLEAAQNHRMSNTFTNVKKCTWYGKCKRTITNIHDESLLADPVTLFGQSVVLKAGGSIATFASRIKSNGNLLVEAADEALYYAVLDQVDYSVSVSKKSSLFGVKFSGSNTTNSRSTLEGQVTQLQSTGNIVSLSGGNTLLQGTSAEYGGTATFQVGVGEKARADARLILEGVKSSVTQTRTQEANYVVWQRLENQGSVVETLRMPTFNGPSSPVFIGPVLAQLPAGDFKAQIQKLAMQPGMGYLNDLAARRDVKWQEVKLAHDRWDFKQQGLTPAGAALISVAVAWATGGVGADILGAVGLGGNATAGLAANAAFTSLASQASITLVNNKGNIGKTLNDLASSTTVKATLSAALTAGVMETVGALPALKSLKASSAFTDKLTLNLVDASGRALINTSINGGSLQESLKSAILSASVDTAHALAASEIKVLEADYLSHKIAHALAGCAAGAAGGTSCRDSAIGAAVGEIVAGLMPPANGLVYSDSERARVLAMSQIAAGGVAAYAGGNASTAISSAETAVKNNALVPLLIGLAWLADKAWTAYQVAQDVADIRDGKKTIEQVAKEKGEGYVTGIILGNVAKYGIKGAKGVSGWIQSRVNHQIEIKSAFNKASAVSGKIIGSTKKLTPDELSFVKEMQSRGHTIEIIETGASRTPDFIINGIHCELKTLSNVVDTTFDGLSSAVKSRIMAARGQSANIIIDARKQPGMTLDVAEAGARRAIGADTVQGSKISNLVVLTDSGPVIVTKAP